MYITTDTHVYTILHNIIHNDTINTVHVQQNVTLHG